jgi:hypothetical protein
MLTKFDSFEHQDRLDLEYGKQLPACERLGKLDQPAPPQDSSIEGDWTPEED